MNKSYILYPNLTNEEIELAAPVSEAELASIVGPSRRILPVELECLVPSGASGKFTLDDDSEELNQSDYVIIADTNALGEPNALACALTSKDDIYGTVILALKEHL
jgi:hypothetical protein